MKKLSSIRREAAKKKFANFGGGGGQSPFAPGLQVMGAMGGNTATPMVNQIIGNETYISVTITNTDLTNDLTIRLFSGYENVDAEPFDGGLDILGVAASAATGLIVDFSDRSHKYWQKRTQSEPLLLSGVKMQFTQAAQLNQVITTVVTDNNGDRNSKFTPSIYKSANQFQDLQIDNAAFAVQVNGSTGIQFKVLKAASALLPNVVTLTFGIAGAIDNSAVLMGKSAVHASAGNTFLR